jgi:hypothetical protein
VDYEQLERIRRKKKSQEYFMDMSNEDKLEYVKESATELGATISEKTVEVYNTVSDYSGQAGEAIGNWFSGLMSQ